MRKFKYSGNIIHIQEYIKKNSKGKCPCIVEIYVRRPTSGERDAFGISKDKRHTRAEPLKRSPRSRKKVEAIPREVFRAHMERRKTSI